MPMVPLNHNIVDHNGPSPYTMETKPLSLLEKSLFVSFTSLFLVTTKNFGPVLAINSLINRLVCSPLYGWFCNLLFLQKRLVSRFIESYLAWKLPLKKYGLLPDHPFEEDYASCQMAILPENFFSEADEGRIVFKRSSKWCFWEGGVELEDKTKLEADVVFLCTGFDGKSKIKSILPEPFRDYIENSSGVMPLYRFSLSLSLSPLWKKEKVARVGPTNLPPTAINPTPSLSVAPWLKMIIKRWMQKNNHK